MFAFIDWKSLDWPHYLALGGGVVLVLALLLYFLLAGARDGLRIPAIVAGSLSGLALGVGLGIVGMAAFGYQMQKPEASSADHAPTPNSRPTGAECPAGWAVGCPAGWAVGCPAGWAAPIPSSNWPDWSASLTC